MVTGDGFIGELEILVLGWALLSGLPGHGCPVRVGPYNVAH